MKKNILMGFIFIWISSACSDLNEMITFRINDEAGFIIPGSPLPNLGLIDIPAPSVKSNSNRAFENNRTRADLVQAVKLEKLTLSIESPSNATFNNIDYIELYISAQGLEEKLLASKVNHHKDWGNTLEMDIADLQLDSYLKQDQYDLRASVELRPASHNVEVKANMTFHATANIFK